MIMEDSYRHKGMRKQLVDIIKAQGITDINVLEAINAVPRHLFLDSSFLERAYEDVAFPIGAGQTISQPYTVAYQSSLMNLSPGMKILEIGTGSGYQASVLYKMGMKVFSIERQNELYSKTSKFLKDLGYLGIRTVFGDGYKGLETFAPFDRILVTAAAPALPMALFNQLKSGGCMVIPVGEGEVQIMKRIWKDAEGQLNEEVFDQFSFVPLLGGQNW